MNGQVQSLPTGCGLSGKLLLMEIGHRIARVRKQAGLTQTELADAVGVTRGLVGQWESHRKSPGRENLAKIAKATLVNVEALLSDKSGDEMGVWVDNPDALKMLRAFSRMSERQRKNVIELFEVSADVSREMKQKAGPSKRKDTVA